MLIEPIVQSLENLFNTYIYGFFVVFTRVGIALFLMVNLMHMTVRFRLLFGLAFCILLTPIIMDQYDLSSKSHALTFNLFISEAIIGSFIGIITQALMGVLHLAGMIIAMQMGMSNAFFNDPSLSTQNSVIAQFMIQFALFFFAVTFMDHILLRALFNSYDIFPLSTSPIDLDHMSISWSTLMDTMFEMAFKLSAPFILISLIFQLSLGILNRLVPQFQIFFMTIPAQILAGFILLSVTIPLSIVLFYEFFIEEFRRILESF